MEGCEIAKRHLREILQRDGRTHTNNGIQFTQPHHRQYIERQDLILEKFKQEKQHSDHHGYKNQGFHDVRKHHPSIGQTISDMILQQNYTHGQQLIRYVYVEEERA